MMQSLRATRNGSFTKQRTEPSPRRTDQDIPEATQAEWRRSESKWSNVQTRSTTTCAMTQVTGGCGSLL